jgi:hypothetical protein
MLVKLSSFHEFIALFISSSPYTVRSESSCALIKGAGSSLSAQRLSGLTVVSRGHPKIFSHFVLMPVPTSKTSFQLLHACLSLSNVICYCVLLPSFTEFCHPLLICLALDDIPFWYFQNSVILSARVFTSGGFSRLSVCRPISHCTAS